MKLILITHGAKSYRGLCAPSKSAMLWRKEGLLIVEELREKSERFMLDATREQKLAELSLRRDRHDIIAEILKTAKEGRKKTYIMYKARLSHSQLKLYLELLNRNGLILHDNGVYKTTPKGLTFVKEFEAINFLFRQ